MDKQNPGMNNIIDFNSIFKSMTNKVNIKMQIKNIVYQFIEKCKQLGFTKKEEILAIYKSTGIYQPMLKNIWPLIEIYFNEYFKKRK